MMGIVIEDSSFSSKVNDCLLAMHNLCIRCIIHCDSSSPFNLLILWFHQLANRQVYDWHFCFQFPPKETYTWKVQKDVARNWCNISSEVRGEINLYTSVMNLYFTIHHTPNIQPLISGYTIITQKLNSEILESQGSNWMGSNGFVNS